jgi:site-specific recombinase XerD/Mn-dependent DtxR family transcriptional regulator
MTSRASTGQQAGSLPRPTRRRRKLVSVPDPIERASAMAEADRRSRQILAQAQAAGTPLLDRNGNPRSPVTLPEYRRGVTPPNKGRKFPIEVLTPEDMAALLAALPRRGATASRNRALIIVLWRCGLRVAEALALMPKDVDLTVPCLRVLHGKGDKSRLVGIDPASGTYIQAWANERAKLGVGPDAPLFCVTRGVHVGDAMLDSGVRMMLKAYARRAGIQKRVHPHGLRHTHAFELSQEDVPVRLIQAQLGHADLAMTAHYIDHLSPKHLLDRIASRPWPAQPTPEPVTTAALSAGLAVSSAPMPPVTLDPAEPVRGPGHGHPATPGGGADRVLEVIRANGGSASQAQLHRALGISRPGVLKQLHALHERGAIIRAGMDQHRSVIWKLALPAIPVRRTTPYKQAPRGEAPRRVLDTIEALGGRASQAEIARTLDLAAHTVHGHCLTLARRGLLERGGLDKSTSRRGSQVWRIPLARPRYTEGGYSLRLAVPRR